MNEPPVGAPFGSPDITSDDRLWAALGYPIPLIPIIVLLMEDKKNRPFIRFHAIQSLALNIIAWVLFLILTTVTFGILGLCGPILWLAFFYPAYVAYQGKYQEIPVVTKFLRGQGWV